MTIEASLSEIAAGLHAIAAAIAGQAPAKAATGKSGKAATAAEPAAASTPPASPAASPSTAADSAAQQSSGASSSEPAVDLKTLAAAFVALVEAKGQPAGRAIIDHFDASKSRLSEACPPEKYAEALALIKAAAA